MVAHIDARIRQLDALDMQEVEIIAAMAEYMSDFHHLMVSTSHPEMDALCGEFSGFYRFAKIIETLASGIASGKIDVPGDRTVNEEHRIAAGIDQRVRQLEAIGIGGDALLERMVGNVLDLQRLWSTTSDESLAFLCREYPGLYRYGMLMEEAAEAESKKATTSHSYSHLPSLPDSVKAMVSRLLTDGAMLERGFQTVFDAPGYHDMWVEAELLEAHHQQWTAQFTGLPGELRAANVPAASHTMLTRIFEPMALRIEHIHRQVVAKRR